MPVIFDSIIDIPTIPPSIIEFGIRKSSMPNDRSKAPKVMKIKFLINLVNVFFLFVFCFSIIPPRDLK